MPRRLAQKSMSGMAKTMEKKGDWYTVESIRDHKKNDDGSMMFKVKWSDYNESEMTWEPGRHLRKAVPEIVDNYLHKLRRDNKPTRQGYVARSPRHSSGSRVQPRKHPSGSWENEVASVDALRDGDDGDIYGYLSWKNGDKTKHKVSVLYGKCPQLMLQFYHRHIKFVDAD